MELKDLLKSFNKYGIKYKLNGNPQKTQELLDKLNESYFNEVKSILNNMSDEEFDKLMVESGIEKCPIENKE